ncbi:MAG: agmatinase [Candidatus Altiarchaeota archaeon]
MMTEESRPQFGGLYGEFSDYDNSRIVILPVPFEKTSTWIKGSAMGPAAIIEASENMELYDIETESEVYKMGIHTDSEITADDSESMLDAVSARVRSLMEDKKFVVTLGGEHTVSIGPIRACSESYDNLSILQLDAHSDLRDSYEDSGYNHACTMRRVREVVNDVVSVGVRSMDSSELDMVDEDRMFYAKDIRGSDDWMDRVVDRLSANVYITLDLDVFDPGIMPSTGTPEPGGLGWYDVTSLLKKVAAERNLVGCDVVELCPTENKAPNFLAAKLIYTLLSYRFNV